MRGFRKVAIDTSDDVFYAKTKLPTEFGDFDVRIFREGDQEHLAISQGDLEGATEVTVRVHSECLTSEVLGSLKCDCKAQLDLALRTVATEGRGVVIYMRQEGRGIGLGNKIRAYALQEQGVDTVDANRLLGLEDDTRDYTAAAAMLAGLGIRSIRLMTNNPEKITGLKALGVDVVERVETIAGINDVNRNYLETKTQRMGHMIDACELEKRQDRWRVVQ